MSLKSGEAPSQRRARVLHRSPEIGGARVARKDAASCRIPMMGSSMRYRHTSPEIERVARSMRASLTPSERRLWSCLKSGRLVGARFRAQHPLGQVVLDFVCCGAKLVVEVDGPYHAQQRVRDRERDRHLEAAGYRVLRFTNAEVDNDLAMVVGSIRRALQTQAP